MNVYCMIYVSNRKDFKFIDKGKISPYGGILVKRKSIIGLVGIGLTLVVSGTLMYGIDTVNDVVAKEKTMEMTQVKEIKASSPVISGTKDWEVVQGENIDVLENVVALDQTGKKIPVVATFYDTKKIGMTDISVTATDKQGKQTTEVIHLTVKAKPKAVAKVTEEPKENPVVTPVQEEVNQEVDTPVQESRTMPETTNVVEDTTIASEVPSESNSFQANTMLINGQVISYTNAGEASGQSVIDSNPNMVATWGGMPNQSGQDGCNTHFIGHNYGAFNVLFSVSVGNDIQVADSQDQVTTYRVSSVFQVDDYGYRVSDGKDVMDEMINPEGGERITLQTCVNQDINLIVEAVAI